MTEPTVDVAYDNACERAATEQGLDPLIAALTAAGVEHRVEQTGGLTMAVTHRSHYGTWAFRMYQQRNGGFTYEGNFYADEDWSEGGTHPLSQSLSNADYIAKRLLTEATDPWLSGQHVEIGGPARITWVNPAPRDGFWWVGYRRGDTDYAGVHVDAEGRDNKGRTAITRRDNA